MSERVKIRVAGTQAQVEILTEQLRTWSKQWGNRKIFRVKRYDRKDGAASGKPWKFHPTFGARRFVNYITMKLPKAARHPVCMMEGHSGDKYCGRCGAKMPEDPQEKCGLQFFGGDTGIDADFQWPVLNEEERS